MDSISLSRISILFVCGAYFKDSEFFKPDKSLDPMLIALILKFSDRYLLQSHLQLSIIRDVHAGL